MLKLRCGELEITISNSSDSCPSADNRCRFERTTSLDGGEGYLSSQHAVAVRQNGEEIASHLVVAGGGASGIHQRSALLHQNRLFLVVGDCLCALEIPALDLVWSVPVDNATCFGVHLPPRRDCLISHGELEISRLSFDGNIEWQSRGADIFTGTFEIFENEIEAEDWNGQRYRIDMETGESVLRDAPVSSLHAPR